MRPTVIRTRLVHPVLAALALAACGGPAFELTVAADATAPTLGDTVTATGTLTPLDGPVVYAWDVAEKPAGSAATPTPPDAAVTTFVPDLKGRYRLVLTAQDAKLRTGGGLSSRIATRPPVSQEVVLEVKPRPALKLQFAQDPTDIIAGESFAPPVRVQVLDAIDGVVESFTGTLTLQLQGNGFETATVATKAFTAERGEATFDPLTVERAGTYTLVANVGEPALTPATSAAFTVRPAAPDAAHSEFTADPGTIEAGTGTSTLHVVVRDRFNNPVPDVSVGLKANGSDNTIDPASATSAADGGTSASFTSTKAEEKTLTATFGDVTLTTTVVVIAGPPDRDHSTLVANPIVRVADGLDAMTLTATLADAYGNPTPGAAVEFSVTGTRNTLDTDATVSTSAGGVAETHLTSTKAEYKTVSATVNGWALQADVRFIPGVPDRDHSTFEPIPAEAVANGIDAIALTATLRDAHDNPVPQYPVAFYSNGDRVRALVGRGTTDAGGITSAPLTSTRTGTVPVDAEVGEGLFMLSTVARFIAGPPSAPQSDLIALPDTLVANGQASTTLQASIRDQYGNPVAGVTVTFDVSGTLNSLSSNTAVTDTSGVAQVELASTKAEVKTVTASFGTRQEVTTRVNFLPGTPVAAHSTFTATPDTVVANGTATSTLVATLRDAYDNVVAGAVVGFSGTGTANTFSSTSATTDENAAATVTIKSTKAEAKTVTATFGVEQALTTTVTFIAGPPDAARSTFTAAPASLVANGVATSTLTLTAKDANDNLVSGATVALTATLTGNTFGAANGTTNASGVYTTTLSSLVDGARTVTAAVTKGTSINKTASVTFLEAPPEIIELTAPVSTSSCAPFTYKVKQLQSKPVNVRVEVDPGTGTFGTTFTTALASEGLTALTSSGVGAPHSWTWNTTTDWPHQDKVGTRIRLTPSRNGVDGVSQAISVAKVENDLKFTQAASFTGAFTTPRAVAAGDLNRDGRPDIAVVSPEVPSVSVFMNQGNFTFAAAVTYPTGENPCDVRLEDFQRDGDLDLVVSACGSAGGFNVLPNLGNGTFGPVSAVPLGLAPGKVRTASINRDYWPDLVTFVSGASPGLRLIVSATDGTYDGRAIVLDTGLTRVKSMSLGDFNRDGFTDAVYTDQIAAGNVAIRLGALADPYFGSERTFAGCNVPTEPVVGDFDHDGKDDFVLLCAGTNTIKFHRGVGDGTFTTLAEAPGFITPIDGVARDINNDGHLDLVSSIATSGLGLQVALGRGDGTFRTPVALPNPAPAGTVDRFALADFDNDGRLDATYANYTGGAVVVQRNVTARHCDPGFRTATAQGGFGSTLLQFAVADFDRDGKEDVATADGGGLNVGWGNGAGAFTNSAGVALGLSGSTLAAVDFDRDGWLDIAVASSAAQASSNNLVMMRNLKNRTFAVMTTVAITPDGTNYPAGLGIGDMNRDGWPDVLVTRPGSGTPLLYSQNKTAQLSTPQYLGGYLPAPGTGAFALYDYDQDGKLDVASTGNEAIIAQGAGAPPLTLNGIYATDVQLFNDAVSADFDNDGFPDVAMSSQNASFAVGFGVMLSRPTNTFLRFNGTMGTGPATTIAALDLDGDGFNDVGFTSGTDLRVAFLNGTGVRATQSWPMGASGIIDSAFRDLNFDGLPDAVLMAPSGSVRVMLGK